MSHVFTKHDVSRGEYVIYKLLDNMELKFIPKFYSYDKESKILRTNKIDGDCVSNIYGENFDDVPENVIKEIRSIVTYLYFNRYVYPDITGYNFIEDKNKKIWIVDFEHCFIRSDETQYSDEEKEHLEFVKKFCLENEQSWNPYFA